MALKQNCTDKKTRPISGDEGKALELIGSVKEEKHLQTAAMLAFKTNREVVAKQSLQRAVQVSKDPQFILPAARFVVIKMPPFG